MKAPSTGNASPPPGTQTSKPGDTQRSQPGDEASGARSETRANVNGEPAPKLPHERDESSGSGDGAPRARIRKAHDDLAAGRLPTDKGEATDAVYRSGLRGRTPGAERD